MNVLIVALCEREESKRDTRRFGMQNRYGLLKPCFSFVTIKAQAMSGSKYMSLALQRIADMQRTDA